MPAVSGAQKMALPIAVTTSPGSTPVRNADPGPIRLSIKMPDPKIASPVSVGMRKPIRSASLRESGAPKVITR